MEQSIAAFAASMRAEGARRAHFVHRAGRVVASHAFLEPIARALAADAVDYERHEGIFVELGTSSGALLGAFVHRTVRGQAAGGVRLAPYDSIGDYLVDGIRLSKGMTHKNALAGLWWGGGKGVIAARPGADLTDAEERARIYRDFGRLMSSLRGCYVTAEDAGTTTDDMAQVFGETRFTTCIPERLGGSGNPSVPTARGVVCGIEAALEHRGLGGIAGKAVAIQGAGHVGRPLVDLLLARGATRVVVSDVSPPKVALDSPAVTLRIVERDDMSILAEEVDVVCPCAIGGTLNAETIPTIRAPIVCGAANNQLRVPAEDGPRLAARGITYVPDFLVNRMGIVNCANEQYGYVAGDEDFARHLGRDWSGGIYQRTRRVLAEAERNQSPPDVEALRLAEALAAEPHPIWGHRGVRIIDGLLAEGWAEMRGSVRDPR